MKVDLQIISKGLYKGTVDNAFPIEVKEYVFTRKDGQKCLLLRFLNQSRLNVTALNFWLVQKNSFGEQIAKEKISIDKIVDGVSRIFSPTSAITVQEKCVDFDVEMISLFSEEYEYISENGECFIKYHLKESKKADSKANKKANKKSDKRKGSSFQCSKLDKKVKFAAAILVLAIFLILFAIIWPFFKQEILPLIKEMVTEVFELLGDLFERFFKSIGELFKKDPVRTGGVK